MTLAIDGARLGVGAVGRQLVRVAERLVAVAAAQTAGQVHAGRDHVPPASHHRVEQLLDRRAPWRRRPRRNRGRAVERHGRRPSARRERERDPASTPGRNGRPRAGPSRAPRRSEPPARGSVARRSSGTARRAPSRSPGDRRSPARPAGPSSRSTASAARVATLEQPVVAERALPGDRGLDEVADGVQLVAPGEVPVLAARRDHLDVAVEVAVGPLGALRRARSPRPPGEPAWLTDRGRAPSRRPRATCTRPYRGTGR